VDGVSGGEQAVRYTGHSPCRRVVSTPRTRMRLPSRSTARTVTSSMPRRWPGRTGWDRWTAAGAPWPSRSPSATRTRLPGR
jgi:hypothetical protein